MHDDVKRILQWHDEYLGIYQRLYHDLTEMIEKVKRGEYPPEILVDLGFLCREMGKVSDDLRKECEAKKDLIGRMVALSVAQQDLDSPGADQTVRGELASGTPDVSQQAAIPKFGTPEYGALCAFLGLTGDAVQKGIVGFSFTRLSQMVTEMASQGRNPPPGVLKTYPKFQTVFVSKRTKKE